MDIAKIRKILASAYEELNALQDSEFKKRRVNGLRSLGNAANALQLAEKHIEKAVAQVTPKPAAEAPAAEGAEKKK